MAKKKKESKVTELAANFEEIAAKLNEAKRAMGKKEAKHVPRIPKATIFMDGKRIVLNDY